MWHLTYKCNLISAVIWPLCRSREFLGCPAVFNFENSGGQVHTADSSTKLSTVETPFQNKSFLIILHSFINKSLIKRISTFYKYYFRVVILNPHAIKQLTAVCLLLRQLLFSQQNFSQKLFVCLEKGDRPSITLISESSWTHNGCEKNQQEN